MLTGVVPEFRGEYKFLSNYDQHEPFEWRDITFTSGEQAFAYAKTFCAMTSMAQTWGGLAILEAKTPGEAKKIGRSVEIDVAEWDRRKIFYMREITHAKFSGVTGYAGKLINTGAMMLVEGNDWNDTFWGRCNGKGFNTLGVILMEERGYWLRSDFK
jgi:ribA/ribD-fused uncharacterized protein